ncbi:hypothetical protein MMC29_007110 [Sticta canariensis]|nr:hypothetical protein [Sticta canariensis]
MASLLSLPRELRNLIYQASLVSLDIIDISEVNIEMRPLNPDLKLNVRRTWQGEIEDPEDETILYPMAMTYQMSFPSRDENLGLNLFLANRQIYNESRQVFYEQNRFRFSEYYLTGIPACLAFLQDRPPGSLRYIRDVQLDIGRYLTLPGWHHIPMRFWRPLCDQLTQHLSLRSLGLSIYTYGPDVRQNPWRTGYNSWKRHEDWDDNPDTHDWVHELLRITGLEKVTVSLQNCRSKAENDAFLDLLRSNMVKRDEHGAITGSFTSEVLCPDTNAEMPTAGEEIFFKIYSVL